jgi:toxin ParE1/3/4
MRIEFSALAALDYDNIVDHSISEFGAAVALAYADTIEAGIRQLENYPLSGRPEPSLHRDIRSLSCKSHRLYYSVDDNQIIIRRILHKSMDAENWLS